MTAANDFNYKVALASGLRDLQAGRLRQAEEQFRYLAAHFPAAGGGHRGLAKVFVEQGDRAAALATLRAGAASLAKAGDRSGGIGLLREAIPLGPTDPVVHRHLAAALTLAGLAAAAVEEQRRFANAAIDAGQRNMALREIRYALSTSGDDPALVSVAVACGLSVPELAAPQDQERTVLDRSVLDRTVLDPNGQDSGPGGEPSAAAAEPPHQWAPQPAPRSATADPRATSRPIHPAEPVAPGERGDESTDELAARYIAARDPRAADTALAAAREFLAAGRTHAASDLLLQVIASGLADHQAQRLLIEVATSIGNNDVARAKCALLAEALRLDGQTELAVEVERLAQAV